MMDFNLILLLVGLGLLVLVAVFVLLGCFAGLKKELKCAAIGFVVLLLTLLVFGNSSTILDANGALLKNFIQGIPSSAETIWDCVLALVQSNVPGGAEIFAEGTKSYAFLYSVVSGVARGAMLIIGTLVMFILCTIGLGIYRLVSRIVAHNKAKNRAKAGVVEPQPEPDKAMNDNVLVAQSEAGESEGVMITANKEPVKKGSGENRAWAGALAGLRAVIAIIFLFAPVSGVCSILDEISPETETLINESLSGNKQNTAASNTILDTVLDFKDAYYDSAVGKFIEGSKFFFGESFSTQLFDSAFVVECEKNNVVIRDEAIVIIDAVNALEGNANIKDLELSNIANALDALKDSKLIVEAMPVAIEVAYHYPINANGNVKLMGSYKSLKDLLFVSKQQAAFLELRNADWDKNIEILFDVVKEAYKLGILEEGFNFLTMDPEQLGVTLGELAKSDVVNNILNIAVQTALKLDVVKEKVGDLPAADLSDFSWAEEYQTIVEIYEEFQKLEITSLNNLDAKALVSDIVNDETKLEVVANVVKKVTELQLLNKVGYNALVGYLSNMKYVTDAGTDVVKAVKDLKNVNWSSDINIYVEAAVEALKLVEIGDGLSINADYFNLDPNQIQVVFDTLFATESFEKLLPIAVNVATNIVASSEKVKEKLGDLEIVIDTANVDWKQDFTTLVSIYKVFQDLDINSLDEMKDAMGLAKDIFAVDGKVGAVKVMLLELADMTLYGDVVVPVADAVVANLIHSKVPNFEGILDLTSLDKEAWKNDFSDLVAIVKNVYDICGFDFKLDSIDFNEVTGDCGKETIELLFNLNLLDSDETKNKLVIAALKQFNLFTEEQLANVDLSEVKWNSNEDYSEVSNFKEILSILNKVIEIEGIDLNAKKFDYNAILSNNSTYGYAVDLLDVVVESKLILELMPGLIEKFVLPQVEKWDDEDSTLNKIITDLESKELVLEVQKLVDVAKAVIDLNVLEYKSKGIQAIDFANTDAIKTIINGIFDSKLLEGYESRVVRIILKVTQLFPDLEKGTFDHVDFDKEQAILIAAIDELEVVLKDENFLTFDENGKIKLEKEYYLKEETLDALLGALKALFGEYKVDSSVDGSQIIETLLPDLFEKFVANLIPDQYEDLMEILNIEGSHPRLLVDDVRKVIYIAELLVNEKVQSYLLQNDYNFANILNTLQTVVTTVFKLNMVSGSEAELVAWALNYAQTSAKLNVGTFTADDFALVDWDAEVNAINELLADVVRFTNNNNISSVKKLINFINNKDFLKDDFFEVYNYNVVFEIIEDLFNLQTVEQILPVGLEYALKLAKDKNYDVTFLGEHMTGELLVEDVKSIVDALKIAVYDIQILEYKKANWTGELPAVEHLVAILDIIVNLNVLENKENQLLRFAVDKFIPANPYISASDFTFDYQYNFDADYEIIRQALPLIYDLIHVNNITKLEEVKAFFTEKWYANTDLVKDYNILAACDLIELLSDLQLVEQALIAVVNSVVELEAVEKIGDFSSLTNLTKPELVSDVKTLVSVVRQAVAANLLQYYESKDLAPINYEALAGILETIGTLNVVNNCANEIVPQVINYIVANKTKLNINYTFTREDFAEVDWVEETKLLGQLLVETGVLFEDNNLDSLSDILLFFNHKHYTDSILYTNENANQLVKVLDVAVDSKLVKAVAVVGFEFALNLAKDKGFDITFLSGKLNSDQLVNDLGVVVEIAQNAIDFGAVEYFATQNISNIDTTYVANIVASLEKLNVLTCAQPEWTALVVSKVAPLLKLDVNVMVDNYKFIDYANENALLQEAVLLIGELLGNENIQSIDDIKHFIANKDYLNINAYNDRAIANAQDLLLLVAESDILGVHLVDLFEYAASIVSTKTKFDVSFVNDVFTTPELQDDIKKLVEISDYLVEFGIVDLIFTGDVVINLDPAIEAVKLLEEVNLLYKTNDYIAEIVYNLVLPKLGIKEQVSVDDFKYINFANENSVLVSILEEVKVLLAAEDFITVSDVVSFVKNREYLYSDKYEQTFNNEAIESVFRIVQLAVTSELVKLELVPLFNLAVSKVPATVDVAFLKDSVTADELVSDVDVLIKIARLAIEFGALEYVFTKNIEVVELDPIVEIVALLEQLNIATKNNKEFTALVFNMIYDKLGINNTTASQLVRAKQGRSSSVQASEFVGVDYASENAILQEVIELVGWLQADFMLTSLEEIIAFVNNKEYINFKEFAPIVYSHVLDVVNAAMNSVLVQYSLPTLLDFGLDKAAEKGIDLTYLSGKFTGEQLASDVKVLAKEAVHWVRDNAILDAIDNKAIQPNYLDELAKTVVALKEVNLVNYEQAKLVTILTNLIYEKAIKYQGTIEESYFDDVVWTNEFDNVAAVLTELGDIVETFGVEHNLLSLEGLKEFVAEAKNLENYNDETLLNNVAELLVAVSKSSALLSELEFGQEYLISYLASKEMDVHSIYTTKEGIAKDLVALSNVLAVVYPSNVLGFAGGSEPLNQEYVDELVSAIESVLDMNLLENSKADILDIVFNKIGVNVDKAKLDAIVWENEETDTIGDLLLAANDLLVELDLFTLNEIKEANVKQYLTINYETNERLVAIKDVINVALTSQLVEASLFGISEKYLSNEKVAGVADLHNIYNNYEEVKADLNKVVGAIDALVELDLCSFLIEGSDIPYEKKAAIETIISNVFTLNYLNNEGRINELVTKYSPVDVSSVDFSNVNLAADAEILVAAYEELYPILTDEKFFLKNKNSLQTINVNDLVYLTNEQNMPIVRSALTKILETSLVTETNGAIFLLFVPLIKQAAPKYYAAIDPERLTIDELGDDVKAIFDLVKDLLNADLNGIIHGKIFNSDVENLIVDAINTIANLNLLNDRFDDVALVVADDLDSKRIGNYYFDKSLYNLTDVMYKEDLLTLIDIITVVYDLCENENITTINEAKAHFTSIANIKALLKDSTQVDNVDKVINLVTELTFAKYNILPVYNELLQNKLANKIGSELADVTDVYDSSEEMINDIAKGLEVLRDLVDLGAVDVLNGATINFDQAELVKKLLADIALIEYVNVEKQNLLEFVDSKISIDLSQLDVSSMDVVKDLAIFGEMYEQLIPVLLSDHNPFTTVSAVKALTIAKSDLFALIYDYQSIYPSVVTLLSEVSIAPQLVKFGAAKVENRLSGLLQKVVETLDVENAGDADIIEDLVAGADVLTYVEKLDLLRKVLYKEDIAVTDNETIAALAASLFELNIIDNNFLELVIIALEDVLHLDLTGIELVVNDVDAEQALLVDLCNNGVIVMNNFGVENLSDVKPTIRNIKSVLRQNYRSLRDQAILEVVHSLVQSELFTQLAIPTYEQKVYPKLSGTLAIIGDISNYSQELFVEDLALMAQMTQAMKDSGLDALIFDSVTPTQNCVPYLEDIIRNACMLNIVEVKKGDVPVAVQSVFDSLGLTSFIRKYDQDFDLSNYDLSSVNFKSDADIYASMAQQVYVVIEGIIDAHFSSSFFANTEAITALVEMYEISLDTTLVKVVAARGLNAVTKLAAKFKMTVNENDEDVLVNIANFLYGLIELGVFGTEGIDFTDKQTTDMMVQAVYNSITLPAKAKTLVDKVASRLYAYGVVPFDWDAISIKHELRLVKSLVKQVAAFDYEISRATLVNPSAQADMSEMIRTISDSSFVEQLFFPFVEGTFNALTLGYTDGEMVYNATIDDVVEYSLPNFWRVVNAVYDITEFRPSNITVNNMLENLDAVAEIVEVFGTDIMLKDNVAKIIATGIGKYTSHDLTEEQLAKLLAIDFENEVQYSNAFFAKLQETYNNYPFTLDMSMLKDENVVRGLAEAMKEIIPSETVKVLARIAMKIANNRVAADIIPDASSLVTERLEDAAYTDELIVDDLYMFADILINAAESGILRDRNDFSIWNFDAVRNIVDLCFDTNIAKGYEKEFCEACLRIIPVFDEYYDSSMVITDWEKEIKAIIDALEELKDHDLESIADPLDAAITGDLMVALVKSEIITHAIVKEVNESLTHHDFDIYMLTDADVREVQTVAQWDAELVSLRKIVALGVLNSGNELNDEDRQEIIDAVQSIEGTILCDKVLSESAETLVPKLPVIKNYPNAYANITGDEWSVELHLIIDALDVLPINITSVQDPIKHLTGEMMVASLKSEILTKAIVEEFNKNLINLDLPFTVVENDLTSIQTAAEWDTELDAIIEINKVLDNYENGTVTYAQVMELYNRVVNETVLAEKILVKALNDRGIL